MFPASGSTSVSAHMSSNIPSALPLLWNRRPKQHSADYDEDDDDRNRFIYLNTAILHDRNRFIYLNTAILSLSTLFSTNTDQPIIVNLSRAMSEAAQTRLWSLWCQRRCQYRMKQLAVPGTQRTSFSVCPLYVPPGTWT